MTLYKGAKKPTAVDFQFFNFIIALGKNLGIKVCNKLRPDILMLKTGDDLEILTSDLSNIKCNFIGYTTCGEMAVNFAGKGLVIIPPAKIKEFNIKKNNVFNK